MSGTASHVGDVTVAEAFELIQRDPAAVLVDVRTRAEWAYVGAPDLSGVGKQPIFLEWQQFPAMTVDADFVAKLTQALDARGTPKDAALLFLCRSGARSLAAARAMSGAGYARCLNVAGGFEGPPDQSRHRGSVDGWKAKGLPWVQS
jgi:rhodanese-related sulfurtransferase